MTCAKIKVIYVYFCSTSFKSNKTVGLLNWLYTLKNQSELIDSISCWVDYGEKTHHMVLLHI